MYEQNESSFKHLKNFEMISSPFYRGKYWKHRDGKQITD